MTNEWCELTIGDIATVVGGGTPSTEDENNFHGEIPWITPKDLSGYPYRYISRGERNISEKGMASSNARLLPKGAILLTTRAPVGYVAIASNPVTTNQGFRSLVLRDGFDPEFVYYLLKSNTEYLQAYASGTTFGELSGTTLKSLKFFFPPSSVQRAIADILSAFDNKIELNRQANETLEAIARAIFRSWFIDFDPVYARMEDRQPYGMDAETTALFPAAFEESAPGEIPQGWKVASIGESVRVVGGSTPRTQEPAYWEGGTIYWATPKDLASLSSPILLHTERRITEKGLQQISSGLLPQGTVLLSSRAPVGYLAMAEVPLAINQGFIAMVCERELPNYYVLHWARANMSIIKGFANGTTFLEISKTNFRPINVVIPPQDILRRFTDQVKPIYQNIKNNLEQSHTLAAIRDILQPRLLSGELDV
jgi:type I restriction enzyme S subunit